MQIDDAYCLVVIKGGRDSGGADEEEGTDWTGLICLFLVLWFSTAGISQSFFPSIGLFFWAISILFLHAQLACMEFVMIFYYFSLAWRPLVVSVSFFYSVSFFSLKFLG